MSDGDHYGFNCTCGAENFQRVVVERVVGRPVVTDLVACVECHIVFYVPLPPPLPVERSGPSMSSGVPSKSPGLAIWGGVALGSPGTRAEPRRATTDPGGCRTGEQVETAAVGAQTRPLYPAHSTTRSAWRRSTGGIFKPSASAVLRLMTNSIFIGCWMGMLLAFSPRRTLSTYEATRRKLSSPDAP